MTKLEKVFAGLSCHSVDNRCDECPYSGSSYCSEALALDTVEVISLLQNQIVDTKSCKTCAYYDRCDPSAASCSPEFRTFAECRGSAKWNWKWKGVDLQ